MLVVSFLWPRQANVPDCSARNLRRSGRNLHDAFTYDVLSAAQVQGHLLKGATKIEVNLTDSLTFVARF